MNYQNCVSLCARLAVLSMLSLLAACGGKSEQEEACDQLADGYFPILNGIKCVFGAADGEIVQKASPDGSDTANNSVSYSSQSDEYEPNTSLDNDNSVLVDNAATAIHGSIGWDGDVADNFVFTPTRTGDYHFSLCAATCDGAIGDSTLSLTILDQSQTTIASTAVSLSGEKSLAIRLDAGVAYYAAVNSLATRGNYRLVIVGANDGS